MICHGVPSQQSLHASLRHAIRDIEPTKVTYLSFRNHAKGDFCLECRGFKKDGKPFIFERGIDYSNSYYPAFFLEILIVTVAINAAMPIGSAYRIYLSATFGD